MREIQIEASRQGCRLFRYQVGLFYTRFGTPVKCGTAGVSDLIGFDGPRFLAVEVKTPSGRLSEEQCAFLNAVNSAGGLAFCARSVEEFVDKLNNSK